MSLIADLKAGLSAVGVLYADDTTIEYRLLTSNVDANPRTHGAWTTLAGSRIVDREETQVRDEVSGIWYLQVTAQLRVPDQLNVQLYITSQIRTGGTSGQVWGVADRVRSGAGSVQAYTIHYRQPLLQNSRPGGI